MKTTDHLGNTFSSIAEMCEYYGIVRQTFAQRMNTGCTLEEALVLERRPRSPSKHKILNPLAKPQVVEGITYPSVKAVATHYGLDYGTLRARMKVHGLTAEQAVLHFVPKPTGGYKGKGEVIHNGITYPNFTAAAIAHGINHSTVVMRLQAGRTMAEALLPKSELFSRKNKPITFRDVTYPSQKALCEAYQVSYHTFSAYRSRGYPIEYCLGLVRHRTA